MKYDDIELVKEYKDLTDFPVKYCLQVNYCGLKKNYTINNMILRPYGRKDYCLYYVASGWFNILDGDQTRRINAGECIFFQPNVRQSISFPLGSNTVFYCAYFTGSGMTEVIEPLKLSDITVCFIDVRTMFEMLFHQLFQCYLSFKVFNGRKPMSSPKANGLMLQLIDLFSQNLVAKVNSKLDDVASVALYISEHFREGIDMRHWAALSHLSLSRFSHSFTKKIGASPYKFAISLRMDEAKELLMHSSMSIKEIAQSVGYTDSSYFSRIFHKYTGHTPSEYRQKKEPIDRP